MANELSWNPPKWKSYSFDGKQFEVELETGEIYTGFLNPHGGGYIIMKPDHSEKCYKIFGQYLTSNTNNTSKLSKVLDLKLNPGNWPVYQDVKEFLKRYYERVAKIEESFTKSIISIESEFDITPKFTL